MVGAKWRSVTGMALQSVWAVSYMAFGLIAFFVRDWMTLQLIISVPTILLFVLFM